jgi:Cof subfamily protein (haloacid dehalogenase superfamily)
MKIKLIASDIDGTIINSEGYMSDKTVEVINSLKDHDIDFTFATGRSFESTYDIAKQLDQDNPFGMICLNGLQTFEYPQETKIELGSLTYDEIIEFGEFGKKFYMGVMYCYDDAIYFQMDDVSYDDYIYGMGDGARHFFNHRVPLITIKSIDEIEERLKTTRIQKIAYIQSPEYMSIIISRMHDALPEGFGLMRVGEGWTEVSKEGVSKGEALLAYAAKRGIKPEEIMVFGDSENDISMFEVAGVAVAMGNAMPNAIARSNARTLSNDDNGVAVYIEEYLKNR